MMSSSVANGQSTHPRFPSGPNLTPAQMVAKLARDWDYKAVSLGYPGPVDPGCRAGHNAFAFLGGFRLWGEELQDLEPFAQRTLKPASASLLKTKTPPRARAA